MIITESGVIQITDLPVEYINTEQEMAFDNLTICRDYNDYDILTEENETISFNDEIWIKTKKEIWRGIIIIHTRFSTQ